MSGPLGSFLLEKIKAMISDSIIVAVITGCVTSIGSLLGFISAEKNRRKEVSDEHQRHLNEMEARISQQISNDKDEYIKGIAGVKSEIADIKADIQKMKDDRAELKKGWEKAEVVIVQRIDSLEKAQNKHNQVIERTYKLEADVNLLDEKISVGNHRIADLEAKLN